MATYLLVSHPVHYVHYNILLLWCHYLLGSTTIYLKTHYIKQVIYTHRNRLKTQPKITNLPNISSGNNNSNTQQNMNERENYK